MSTRGGFRWYAAAFPDETHGSVALLAQIDALRRLYDGYRFHPDLAGKGIAFADEQYGARMFIIANDEMPYGPALEPYETIEFKCSGNGEPWAAEFADLDMTPADMERFIGHQIDTPFEVLPGLRITGVGGTIFETKVSMAGVSSRVLRTVGPLEERATA